MRIFRSTIGELTAGENAVAAMAMSPRLLDGQRVGCNKAAGFRSAQL